MRVLTLTGNRKFNVVLRLHKRFSNSYEVVLFNENTRQNEDSITVVATNEQIIANMNQLEITYTEDRLEGDEFSFYIVQPNSNTVLHRNKLFFTAKTPQNYTINE